MMHSTLGPQMMFRSHHKSHYQPDQPLLLLCQLLPGELWRFAVYVRREADCYPDVLPVSTSTRSTSTGAGVPQVSGRGDKWQRRGGRTLDKLRALEMRVVKSFLPSANRSYALVLRKTAYEYHSDPSYAWHPSPRRRLPRATSSRHLIRHSQTPLPSWPPAKPDPRA